MIFGILPNVNTSKHNRDANSVQSAAIMHNEVDSRLNKKPKKTGGKGSLALKTSKQSGCVIQDLEPPESESIQRRAHKSWDRKRSVQFSPGTSRHMKFCERKGPSQSVTQHSDPHDRSSCAPKFEEWEETLFLSDAPAESREK